MLDRSTEGRLTAGAVQFLRYPAEIFERKTTERNANKSQANISLDSLQIKNLLLKSHKWSGDRSASLIHKEWVRMVEKGRKLKRSKTFSGTVKSKVTRHTWSVLNTCSGVSRALRRSSGRFWFENKLTTEEIQMCVRFDKLKGEWTFSSLSLM